MRRVWDGCLELIINLIMSQKYRRILDTMVPKRVKVLHTGYHRMPHYTYPDAALDSV